MKFALFFAIAAGFSAQAHAECYKASTGTVGPLHSTKQYTVVCDDDPPGAHYKNMELTSDQADEQLKHIWKQELQEELEQENKAAAAKQDEAEHE